MRAHCTLPLLGALLLSSCGAPPSQPPAAAVSLSSVGTADPPPPSAPEPPDPRVALRAVICAERAPCHVLREREAGVGEDGRRLSVVSVWAGRERWDEGDEKGEDGAADPNALPSDIGLTQGEREDTTSPSFGGCHNIEYWLVARRGETIDAAHPLLRLCNDGHGAAGVGEDIVTFGDNTLKHEKVGGSNWRWGETVEMTLSPLRVRKTSSGGWWSVGTNMEETSWSWDDFAGRTTWYSPPCGPDGGPEEPSGEMRVGPGERGGAEYAYAALPRVEIEASFLSSGWKTASLGRCALPVDASGGRGFVTSGKPGEVGDAKMRVVASSGGVLFVEIEDDKLVGPSGRWVADDHLEIWMAKALPSYMDHCLKGGEEPVQWAVRLADRKVFAAAGKPDPAAITVERAAPAGGNGPVRLKIGLPAGMHAITVVYSDSDDGRKQERLIATSKLTHGKLATLGSFTELPASRVSCRVEGGKLTPVEKPMDPASFAGAP